MPDLPARFAALIITFAPLFVQRSWLHARVLLIGAILAAGRFSPALDRLQHLPQVPGGRLVGVDLGSPLPDAPGP